MQFYREGYRPGNPDVQPAAPQTLTRPDGLPTQVDVLIVGTGPAGCILAAQLARFPDIDTLIVERRQEPLLVGHADGVACRTVEMFQTFGLAEALVREAYWVNEVRFWGPSEEDRDRIVRTGWVDDTPQGLSEFPHVVVNQARMQQYLLDHMAQSASRLAPLYGIEFVSLTVDERRGDHPVEAVLRNAKGVRPPDRSEDQVVRARYVVGCDGVRSAVRKAIGRKLGGDAANHAWGVMDVLANTDFPDWRTKNVIQSAGMGSLLMIPREGGNMVRCYVDLGEVPFGDGTIRNTTVEQMTERANAILHPYSIDVRSVAWFSMYEVAQRLTDSFDDVPGEDSSNRLPRVFIAGDACHTHSAKAGQGMNVSMQDTFNLGWKLVAVLKGRANPELLRSYSTERQVVAQDLIDFDRFWSAFIAQPMLDPAHPERGGVTAEQMRAEFSRQGRYTAGLATRYRPSALTGSPEHQGLATGFEIGTRFHSAPVTRIADGRRLELGHTHVADGRWRIYAFGDRAGHGLLSLAEWLGSDPDSPIRRFTRAEEDLDAVIDTHGIFQGSHHQLDVTELPEILIPRTGPLGLQDWEKAWAAGADDVFTERGVSREGAIVVVRPDQYVGHILPLSAREELTAYFAGILLDQPTATVGARARA